MPTTIQALQIIVLLLPGFITASIINMLVFSKGRTDLDKVVEALAYSFIIFTIYTLFFDSLPIQFTDKGEIKKIIFDKNAFIFIFLISIFIGLIISWLKTHDFHMKLLRLDFLRLNFKNKILKRIIPFLNKIANIFKFTNRTSRSSTWSDAFMDNMSYIIINFKDERRLQGWPEKYSDDPDEGFIFLSDAKWLTETEEGKEFFIEVPEPGILIKTQEDIDFIQFIGLEVIENSES